MQTPSDQWDYFDRKVVSLRRNLEDLTKSLDQLEKENSERRLAQRLFYSMKNMGQRKPPVVPTRKFVSMQRPVSRQVLMKKMGHRKPPVVPTRKRPVSLQVLMKLNDLKVEKEDGGLDVGPSSPRKRQRMNYENSSSTSIVSTYGQLVGNERQLAVYGKSSSVTSTGRM